MTDKKKKNEKKKKKSEGELKIHLDPMEWESATEQTEKDNEAKKK